MGNKIVSKNLVGIVPAAGVGSRLGRLPFSKELIPILTVDPETNQTRLQPVCMDLIGILADSGVSHIAIAISKDKTDILRHLGHTAHPDCRLVYVVQDETAFGLPFAIDAAYEIIRDKRVLFGMPDTIIRPRHAFQLLLAEHRASGANLVLGLFPTKTPGKYGMVGFNKASGEINEIIDKPTATTLDRLWGIACWDGAFTDFLHEWVKKASSVGRGEIVIGDIFAAALQHLSVKAVDIENGKFSDIGTLDELESIALRRIE